jgi:hypothetical protein
MNKGSGVVSQRTSQQYNIMNCSIPHFATRRILIVGDVMLDDYLWGSMRRICPEAPVPVVETRGRRKGGEKVQGEKVSEEKRCQDPLIQEFRPGSALF